jgi:hypothetical protein
VGGSKSTEDTERFGLRITRIYTDFWANELRELKRMGKWALANSLRFNSFDSLAPFGLSFRVFRVFRGPLLGVAGLRGMAIMGKDSRLSGRGSGF